MLTKVFSDYGMVLVLIVLCALFSVLTLNEQTPTDSDAIAELLGEITGEFDRSAVILVVGEANKGSGPFAEKLREELVRAGYDDARVVVGIPRDLRVALDEMKAKGERPAVIATSGDARKWGVIEGIGVRYPEFSGCEVLWPESYIWPDFLKRSNLLAIVDRIVVIAVIAIGMTMVIITAGIDLSVGSLIALAAVISTLVMKRLGGLEAPAAAVAVGFVAGILCCGVIGALGGFIVARFKVAPFITTLGVMMMARGLAFMITGGFSIYQVPRALPWLGQGSSLGVPNTVILLVVLYVLAHVFMTHTRYGRYIYAVGGNEEAARLSGVPVRWVIVLVYIFSSLAAGLGGCIQASQLNTGTPSIGMMYELYVIAAVVVGGTSLSGGSGRILGTLIGAFIISVIQNGMNLLGMESYTQQIVLGAVILGAVLLDKVRSTGAVPGFLSRKKKTSD
ncbi:MAG: ABC transporter permease [Phycisphaerales bacterium]|nr:MAG: ABC transporter permease [Phycisphaerales bacterium]